MNSLTKGPTFPFLTKTSAVLVISAALIVFGALDALGPHHATSGSPPETSAVTQNRAKVPPEQSIHNWPVAIQEVADALRHRV